MLFAFELAAQKLRSSAASLHYTAGPGFLTCFLAALWVWGRVQSRLVLHGVLVGVVAAVICIALTRAQPEPLAYLIAHALKLLGGACGGFVASRRQPAAAAKAQSAL